MPERSECPLPSRKQTLLEMMKGCLALTQRPWTKQWGPVKPPLSVSSCVSPLQMESGRLAGGMMEVVAAGHQGESWEVNAERRVIRNQAVSQISQPC